jgi:hypothetical protein
MICDDEELAVVRKQLALVEHALEDLRQDVLPKNERNFEVFSEGYVDQIAELKAEIESYAAAKQKNPKNPPRRKRTGAVRKPQKT